MGWVIADEVCGAHRCRRNTFGSKLRLGISDRMLQVHSEKEWPGDTRKLVPTATARPPCGAATFNFRRTTLPANCAASFRGILCRLLRLLRRHLGGFIRGIIGGYWGVHPRGDHRQDLMVLPFQCS